MTKHRSLLSVDPASTMGRIRRGAAKPIIAALLALGIAAALSGFAGMAVRGWVAFGALVLLMIAHGIWKAAPPPVPIRPEDRALRDFLEEPLGQAMRAARADLADARRSAGRTASIYPVLDAQVRGLRKLEKRLAIDPQRRADLRSVLMRELPLAAASATQYVRIKNEMRTGEECAALDMAESALRRASQRLEVFADSVGRPKPVEIEMARLSADAETLLDVMDRTPVDTRSDGPL